MTALTEFYETIRFLMGDRDASVQQYSNATLATAVKSVVRLNKVPGYALSANLLNITPEITNPNQFALVVYHACKLFAANSPERYSYKTRAMGESFGSYRDFILTLDLELHKLENGTMFGGWQSFYSWFDGLCGVPYYQFTTMVTIPGSQVQAATVATVATEGQFQVTFTREALLTEGEYLLGHFVWDNARRTISGKAVAWPSLTVPTVLQLEVDGVLIGGVTLTLPAGTANVEVSVEGTFEQEIAAGATVRWKIVSAPAAPEDCASVCALVMQML